MEGKKPTERIRTFHDPPYCFRRKTYPWRLIHRLPHETDCPKPGVSPASIIVRKERGFDAFVDLPRRDVNYFSDLKLYEFYAKTALTHFNANEGTNLTFVKLVNKCIAVCGLKSYIHLNFTATDGGDGDGEGSPLFFYSEIIRLEEESEESEESEDSEDERGYVLVSEYTIDVKGCSLIEKVDTGNPLGMHCGKCENLTVVHPGPCSGYRVVSGERFQSSDFMKYNEHKVLLLREPRSPLVRSRIKHFTKRLPMFTSCAIKALEHFNHHEKSQFRLVEVKCGFSVAVPFERTVHLNFLAKWPEKFKKHRFFFASVVVPMLTVQRLDDWDSFLEPYILVEGCCQLTKRGHGSYFGRVCEMCINGVIHPGPRDGYEIVAGDCFEDAQFLQVGNGIF